MIRRNRVLNIIAYASIAVLLTSGCATTSGWRITPYGTMNYSQAELERLPDLSIRNILSSISETEYDRIQIFVQSTSLDGHAEVSRLHGQEDVIVTDRNGKEVQIKIASITEIQRLRHYRAPQRDKSTGEMANAVGEGLLYAPLVPVAIVALPFLMASGLDAGTNDDDDEKARLAYGGMSKNDLTMYVGEPNEKYSCRDVKAAWSGEIWVYDEERVLRGGRALFINVDKGLVYHATHNTTFFKNSKSSGCTLIGER